MALKGQRTTTGFIKWENLMQFILKLQRDKEYKFSILIGIGAFTGLRISDILSRQRSAAPEGEKNGQTPFYQIKW